ncbi:MAG: hypothetical protein HPY83_08945 [Anaerolineae bacterium]|nr:hypothetical protein [Anaerolineae bacterium]
MKGESSAPRTQWTEEKILVLVKTYPAPSHKYIETSCIAGITAEHEWLRLYPVQFRMLDKRFRKYQWITARIVKDPSDPRPESHKIDQDSIRLGRQVGTRRDWAERWSLVRPLVEPSMEDLCSRAPQGKRSLGLVRVREFQGLEIQPEECPDWTEEELAKLRREQLSLFGSHQGQPPILEKMPYGFYYNFRCEGLGCSGHRMKVLDWEICESYRKWRREYGGDWEKHLRQKFEAELPRRDLHLYVGTLRRFMRSWVIVGLYYPPRGPSQLTML